MTSFIEAIRIATGGYAPNLDQITPDKMIRFATSDKRGDESGWAKLFHDGEGGVFGDWPTGYFRDMAGEQGPCARGAGRFPAASQAGTGGSGATGRGAPDRVPRQGARMLNAAGDVRADHEYVVSHRIKPCGARQLKDMLLVPLYKIKNPDRFADHTDHRRRSS